MGPRGATAPAVAGPVGARCVPCHSDEEGAIVTVVCGTVLAVGHWVMQIRLERLVVKLLECPLVVQVWPEGVGLGVADGES